MGELWIDFHGPSEPRRLLRDSCQLELLDLYGRAGPALEAYAAHYRAWCDLQAESERLSSEARLSPDELAFMETQLAKLDRLELTDEAVAALERDFQRMSKAQEIMTLAAALESGLSGEDGALTQIAALVREARRLESVDPASKELADRMAAASAELGELASEFGSLGRELQSEPRGRGRPRGAHERMAGGPAAPRARRPLGGRRARGHAPADLVPWRHRGHAGPAGPADRGRRARGEEVGGGAAAVREKAAKSLSKVAAAGIAELGFAKADFRVAITDAPGLGPTGDCGCEFLFSPNVGEAPLPLSRIASSGEFARVMLALKSILADLDSVPVLVFDEVDANVGGEIGSVVGERMAAIAQRHQVLCVTHLPQVAAQASSHFVVRKDQSGDRAVVTIEPIHGDRRGRVAELARMLGDRNAKSALAHAEKLLRAG